MLTRTQIACRILIGTFFLMVPVAFWAEAAQQGKDISYDFKARQLTILGIYTPQDAATNKKSGLDAELEARRSGLALLTEYLEKSCANAEAGVVAEDLKLLPNWKAALRSQGSEIFPNGVLKIALTANLREVFKVYSNAKPKIFKTAEGDPLYFDIPKVPASAVKCGFIKFSVSPRKNIFVAPVRVGTSNASAKIIKLTLAEGNVLQAASQDDLNALLKSDLSKLDSESTSASGASAEIVELPITGG
jgi:hypothetical protein